MNKLIKSNVPIFLTYIVISFVCVSCISSKQIRNFQDISDSTKLHNLKLPPYIAPTVHVDDILSVSIETLDEKVAAAINQTTTASSSGSSGGDLPGGFQVDSLGNIEMITLGKIAVAGLTIPQITEVVSAKAKKYFTDAIVVVRLKSFKVTLLGEVTKPGAVYISTPKANIIDLLGLSQDLTAYAKRTNILLLRHNSDNTISTIRIDLTNSSIFSSPYYYVQSNDVYYVEPNSSKAISSDAVFNRGLTLGTLALSVFTTILYLFR